MYLAKTILDAQVDKPTELYHHHPQLTPDIVFSNPVYGSKKLEMAHLHTNYNAAMLDSTWTESLLHTTVFQVCSHSN